MSWRVELSEDAQDELLRLPRAPRERLQRAIDEFEQRDESQWSNIKALQGPAWRGRFRKRVGPYRIIFRKFPETGRDRYLCYPPQIERHLPVIMLIAQRQHLVERGVKEIRLSRSPRD